MKNSKINKLTNINQKNIQDCFIFYHQYFKKNFTKDEQNTLTEQILSITKYDNILTLKDGKQLPQFTLTIIYFICEYKKAYELSSPEEKEKRSDTHEAIEARYEKRKELYSELIQVSEDEKKPDSTRIVSRIRAFLMEPLVDKKTMKYGWLQFATAYISLIWVKRIYKPFFIQTYDGKTIYELIDESLELFSFTTMTDRKISNTLAILLYDILVHLDIDSSKAIEWVKNIVGTYIEKSPIPRDRYRAENFTEREKYFVGLYNKMPIFQWYIPENKKTDIPYYSQEDLQNILNLVPEMQEDTIGNMMYHYGTASLSKSLKVDFKELQTQLNDNFSSTDRLYKEIKTLHKQYALLPLGLFQHIIITKLSKIELFYQRIIGLYNKLTHFIRKLTQK